MENIELLIYGLFAIQGVVWWSLTGRIESIQQDTKDLNTRLSRIEGILLSKDCCMIKDDKHHKKAE